MEFRRITVLTVIGSLLATGHTPSFAQDGPFSAPTPSNLEETIEYDETDGTFLRGTKLGGTFLEVPSLMNSDEYYKYSRKRSMDAYFRNRYSMSLKETQKDKFDFTDMKFDLGPAEKIFGPGGVQIKTGGSASVKFGYDHTRLDNPSLSLQNRKTGSFDFDEQINLNISGKVGDKINMNLNYNTEATFDFDAKKIKLHYQGKEDEIIRLVEAGNISFPSNSSLIQGSNSLFGIRTDLQFGKLMLQMVLSQKESKSSQVNSSGGRQVTDFELDAGSYDENRHFFLAHFFRDRFDDNMSKLPAVVSGIQITRIEVWVTNKKSSYDSPRNIVAFTDLGETDHIWNTSWPVTGGPAPANHANGIYSALLGTYSGARDIDRLQAVLEGAFTGGSDYEKISNARKLGENEYILNASLGYISLKTALTSDEVLAVAYEYTWNGNSYCSHESDNVRLIGYGWHPLQIARLANRDEEGNRIAPDVVFLCRGTNDATHTPFAKITSFGQGNDEIPETDVINGTDYGFKEALAITISSIQKTYPKAKIFLCTLTPFRRLGDKTFPMNNSYHTMQEYNKAIKEIAEYMGCNVIDFSKCWTFYNCLSEGYVSPDYTHPVQKGHNAMCEQAIKDMR